MRVDFFWFFGEILLYGFAPAGNVLSLIFRTYKKNQVSQILNSVKFREKCKQTVRIHIEIAQPY